MTAMGCDLLVRFSAKKVVQAPDLRARQGCGQRLLLSQEPTQLLAHVGMLSRILLEAPPILQGGWHIGRETRPLRSP